jgi:hypothetical protein
VTTENIYLAILSKPNCSAETAIGFVQDLHKDAAITFNIIRGIENPHKSERAAILKENMLNMLEGYDRLKRGVPNGKRR